MKLKRILTALPQLLLLAIPLVACGPTSPGESNTGGANPTVAPPTVTAIPSTDELPTTTPEPAATDVAAAPTATAQTATEGEVITTVTKSGGIAGVMHTLVLFDDGTAEIRDGRDPREITRRYKVHRLTFKQLHDAFSSEE